MPALTGAERAARHRAKVGAKGRRANKVRMRRVRNDVELGPSSLVYAPAFITQEALRAVAQTLSDQALAYESSEGGLRRRPAAIGPGKAPPPESDYIAEAVVRALEQATRFKSASQAREWILKVARNLEVDAYRRAEKLQDALSQTDELPAMAGEHDDEDETTDEDGGRAEIKKYRYDPKSDLLGEPDEGTYPLTTGSAMFFVVGRDSKAEAWLRGALEGTTTKRNAKTDNLTVRVVPGIRDFS